ncbi:MAG TPA: hypothetical protein VGJ39_14675 [Vicinamibacterales bacterium]|jgi:hypothetical protein
MLIDRTHQPWAVASAGIFVAASVVYLAAVSLSDQPWSGGSAIGLTFGIGGFGMMLFAGLLSVRKKFRIWRVGRAQTWMRGHLWLGLLSLPIILFHAGFTFGGPLTRVMMWLFVIVIVSGVAGAALQHVLPRVMFERLPMETIYEEIPHVRAQLVTESETIVAAACGALALVSEPAAERATSDSAAKLASTVRIDADDSAPLREFYLTEMAPFVADPDGAHAIANRVHADQAFARLRMVLPPSFHGAIADLENICEEERQLARQKKLHLWLHGWLLTHIPLSFALLALAVVHIFTALRY